MARTAQSVKLPPLQDIVVDLFRDLQAKQGVIYQIKSPFYSKFY